MVSAIHNEALEGIAIIGMAGRFPGAKSIEEFWDNLRDGVESISNFTDEELISSGIDPAVLSDPNYVKVGGVVKDVDLFDASFFGFNHREAETTDPQHRLFLECAWQALENAGYDSTRCESRIGVYGGAGLNNYLSFDLTRDRIGSTSCYQTLIGNDKDFLTTRVSYKLNLKGPSFTVQAACSTSLVAITLACQSLLNYQCDMALAGGVSIRVPQKTGYLYQEEGVLSPDGHCHAFDAKAQGTVLGNGVGVVTLKRLADAIADGDNIYAVIKGSAINNDGSGKVGYTAPSVNGQAQVIAEALALAGVEPETISYIEAHGTGTVLGDPIEISALTNVFRESTDKKGFCAIGSVKTNIGHLDAAAGVTSLIKTVLALKHKQIPPSLNFEEPNPEIDFANSPFYVNTKLTEWKTTHTPRRAGVSSLGIGGTNAHVILEEAPTLPESSPSRTWQLLVLSGKTDSALKSATVNLANYLKQHSDLNLADVAYTLQCGRQVFEHRRSVVCRDIADAIAALQEPKRVLSSVQETEERPIAFMFPGLGTQYVNMAWELYQVEPTFRQQVDYCCEFLKPLLGNDLRDVLYPNRNSPQPQTGQPSAPENSPGLDLRKMLGRTETQTDAQMLTATSLFNQTYLAQPTVFVIEYALAQLWMSWGIRPQAMIGYSIGEYVAATLAGVLSLEEGLTLIAARAQMIQHLPGGAMLAVPLSKTEISPLLNDKLSLSAVNGSSMCVVAGETNAVEALEQQLTEKGLACRRLETSHAFHSQMMEAIAPTLHDLVQTFSLKAPKIPYLSNVTGTWITADQATDPSYWVKHLCQAVRFADGVQQLWKKDNPILLEVGCGQTLSSLALQCIESDDGTRPIVLSSLRHSYDPHPDMAFLLNTLGQLWLAGAQINWSEFYAHERRHRIPLPTYPFERQRYWIEPQKPTQVVPSSQLSLEKRPDMADWFYIPVWKQSMPPVPLEAGNLAKDKSCWLLFVDQCGIGSQIAERLEDESLDVITVKVGEQFNKLSEQVYTINPQKKDDYNALLKDLHARDKVPNTIVHSWSVKANEEAHSGVEFFEEAQHTSFYSLLFLAKALGKQFISESLEMWVLSNSMHTVESADVLCPEKSTLLSLCKVIPQEYTNITCRSIDFVLSKSESRSHEKLIDQLMAELTAGVSDLVIAYRGNNRWIQALEPVRLEDKAGRIKQLREGGVYLITGGLGQLGLILAEYLSQSVQAKLVLVGRSGLPAKEEWEQWLATHDDDDKVSTKIKKVQELEKLGSEVLVISADVAHEAQMQAVIDQTCEQFGKIDGVIYAAGMVGEEWARTISEADYTECGWHFQSKVYGLYVLEKVLQGKELDFCFLISSISSILGGLGLAAYAAANIFVDAFAHKQNTINPTRWISANWFYVDIPEESAEAFQRILSHSLVPQVAAWPTDLTADIDKWIKRKSWRGEEDAKGIEVTSSPLSHSNRRNVYVAPRNEIEHQIAIIYQELLGVKEVGIHDNFFELGGHSLIGIQMISQLRQDFQVELSVRHIFETPSVAELALVIEEMLIAEIEELTEDEAEKLVSVPPKPEQPPKLVEQKRYKLPNNLEIFHQNKTETDYFYADIFENRVYVKNGITLRDRACIFDVGANIGLFSLFVNQKCYHPTIYAFEPVPTLFEIVRLNTTLHEVNVKLFNFGLSNETKTATFTFYPNSSGMSSFYPDKEEEKEVLRAIMINQLQSGMTGMEQMMEYADELLEERFKAQTLTCQLRTLSEVISENNVEYIDLLKIDVQKSELDVLQGIKKHDWEKIQQIVIEVHDIEGRLEHITNLLRMQGYYVEAEQENLYEGSVIHNVYAIRS